MRVSTMSLTTRAPRLVKTILAVAVAIIGIPTSSAAADSLPQRPTTTLQQLVSEAMERSPTVVAALRHWQAQTKVPIQAATLPDPQIMFQHLSVGSPRPFAGYDTSDFAYAGFGASQEIPYPGKLHSQRMIAEKEIEVARAQYEAARREITGQISEAYFELLFLEKTISLLNRTRDQLREIAQIAETRYRVGEGLQQDVLKAQLQVTSVLKELAMHHQHVGQRQSELKAAVGRQSDAPDIEIADIKLRTPSLSRELVSQLAEERSQDIKIEHAMQEKSEEELKLARKGYIPDLSLQYMYQRTGNHFPDYYMLSIGAKIPLYFWRKQAPAVEQYSLELESASQRRRGRALSIGAEASKYLFEYQTADRILKLYEEGLIPQADLSSQAALAAYSVGKVDFQTLLSAIIERLNIGQEYYRQVADHELAVVRLEKIAGDLK
jgi:cobalt-zinc-cadmium efflux system outer membrane protein